METEFEEILNVLSENSLQTLKSALGLLETLLKISYIFLVLLKAHFLNDKMKATLLKQCKAIANVRHRLLFSEEKYTFTVERTQNQQNDRVLLRKEIKYNFNVSRSHYPASLMA